MKSTVHVMSAFEVMVALKSPLYSSSVALEQQCVPSQALMEMQNFRSTLDPLGQTLNKTPQVIPATFEFERHRRATSPPAAFL